MSNDIISLVLHNMGNIQLRHNIFFKGSDHQQQYLWHRPNHSCQSPLGYAPPGSLRLQPARLLWYHNVLVLSTVPASSDIGTAIYGSQGSVSVSDMPPLSSLHKEGGQHGHHV